MLSCTHGLSLSVASESGEVGETTPHAVLQATLLVGVKTVDQWVTKLLLMANPPDLQAQPLQRLRQKDSSSRNRGGEFAYKENNRTLLNVILNLFILF